jgi:Ca-activated chloride channel homolog
MDATLSLTSQVSLTPRGIGLKAGGDNTVEILVRIQAPDAPAGHTAQRPPQAIALVIDRSGSMAGRPLAEARRCAGYVAGMLRPSDSVSLVQFDNRVQRLAPAKPLGDGSALRTAIAGINAGGNTNLHGGWHEGATTLDEVPGTGLKRVILLSDGQANEGLTDEEEIAVQCAQWAAEGVTTSTYGLGNNFNEALMMAIARAGGGNHYYGDTAEDLTEPFQQELELLGNLCLRDLRLGVTAPDGVALTMLNDLPTVEGGWRLPDLAWGAEAWAVLRLEVPVTSLPAAGERMTVLRVSVAGLSLDGQAVQLERSGLALPVLAPAAFDALTDDELVSRRPVELSAGEVLTRMRKAAGEGDWALVDKLLEQASRQFSGHEWVGAMLAAMKSMAEGRERERVMKEAMYSSGKLNARLASKNEVSFSFQTRETPAFLRRQPAQGKGDV